MLTYVLATAVSGLLFAIQGPTNTALGVRTNKLEATAISFCGGVLVLGLLLLITGSNGLSRIGQAAPWMLTGGLYGAYGVFVAIWAIPSIGLALTLTSTMLGQLLMGAVIDGLGLMGSARVSISPLRIAGILIVAIGIMAIYFGTRIRGDRKERVPAMLVLLPVSSGVLGAMQSPTNVALSKLIGSVEGSFVSFGVGFIAVLIALLITEKGRLAPVRGVGLKPWMLVGGLYGATAIYLNIVCTPHLGVALLVSAGMLGQLSGGFAVDTLGLLGSHRVPMNAKRLAGILIIAVGVVCVSIARGLG